MISLLVQGRGGRATVVVAGVALLVGVAGIASGCSGGAPEATTTSSLLAQATTTSESETTTTLVEWDDEAIAYWEIASDLIGDTEAAIQTVNDVITSGDLSDSGDVNRMVDAIDQVYAIDKQVRAMIPPNGLAGVHDRLMAGIEHYALGCDLLVQGMLHLDEDFLSPAYDEWNLGREMIEELIAFVGDAPWGVPRQVSWTLSP